MKKIIFLLLLACAPWLQAQQPAFKHAYSEKDKAHLISVMKDCLGYEAHMKFSFSGDALFNSAVGTSTPASPEEIERLKGTLTGNDEDANIYLDISGNYSMLKMPAEAEEYRRKAMAIAERLIAQYPDSVTSYLFLAGVYNGAVQFDKVIYYYRKAFEVKPSDPEPLIGISSTYVLTGQLDSALENIRYFLKTYPDNHRIYGTLAVYYLQVFAAKLQEGDPGKLLDSGQLLDMPMLEELQKKHAGNKHVEFLYHVARQVLLVPAVVMSSAADTSFDVENIRFKVPPKYQQELGNAKAYFEKCLKAGDADYYYYANKMLGSIYLLENQPKKAVPYLRKTIDLKPVKNCTFTSNSNEDYYNLLAAYVILKDTAGYEKLMLEKIKLQPSINPNPRDYAELAALYLCRGKHELAKTYYQKAVEIDERYENMIDPGENTNALVGLGHLEFVNNNPDGAMDDVNRAFKVNPRQWELFVLYACILIQQGDANNAYDTIYILKGLHDREWIKEDLVDYFFVGN